MRKIVWLLLLSSVISRPLFTEQDGPDRLRGIVVSENGTPVSGVKIFAWHNGMTDAEGRFELPNPPSKDSVIYFQKEGLRPKPFVVKAGATTLKVVVEDDSETAWLIPVCATTGAHISPVGYELKFLLPEDSHVKKLKDIDYQEYLVSFGQGTAPLQLWWGPLVQPGKMLSDLILESASFEERSIRAKHGETLGFDTRGTSLDGKYRWRAAGFAGLSGASTYEWVSKEVATAYDRIIDSACRIDRMR
jgi:hypothetical protein